MSARPEPSSTAATAGAEPAVAARVAMVVDWLRARAGSQAALCVDSRNVRPGDVFVALPGRRDDGRRFVDAAQRAGAVAVLVEVAGEAKAHASATSAAIALAGRAPAEPMGVAELPAFLPTLPVPDLMTLLGPIAASYYDHPSAALHTIAVTGTNGKTSITQWLGQLMSGQGRRAAVIGTLGAGLSGQPPLAPHGAGLTTPDAATLQRQVRDLRDAGALVLAIEASSIGLVQGRLAAMHIDTAIFTQLSRDHLDYHGTFEAYAQAKSILFDWPGLRCAVINLDDPIGRRFAAQALARGVRVTGYRVAASSHDVALHDPATDSLVACDAAAHEIAALTDGVQGGATVAQTLQADRVRATATGMRCTITHRSGAQLVSADLDVALVGSFNIANLLAVLGAALEAGVSFEAAMARLPQLLPPEGRMQRVGSGEHAPLAVVDYAHTPDAVVQALRALRPLSQARGGALWIVLGAGGDRDPGKRAPMGASAARHADRVVITSDNPRSESPEAIAAAVKAGADEVGTQDRIQVLIDRAQAIAWAVAQAAAADVVLVAGKGHESYQEINGQRLPFSDVAQVRSALAVRGRVQSC